MQYTWIGERVAVTDLERVLNNIFDQKDDISWGPNNTFRFPVRGGTGAVWRECARRLPQENIRYNTEAASFEDVVAAAQAVAAHDFIMKLPDGYQTKLGQRGRNISMGQRQLISFARALVADPQILILDEATANIDSFTEQAIQKALKVLFEGRTCIVIAHRLATIRDADRIIVLQQGRILEQGNHAELMATDGLYSHLYTSAHASFDDQVVATTGDAEFATRT